MQNKSPSQDLLRTARAVLTATRRLRIPGSARTASRYGFSTGSADSFWVCMLIIAVVGLLPLSGRDAQARHGAPGRTASEQAQRLRADGAAALAEHKLEAARQALDESYERYPASETLYYLGQLALAEGHPIEAQDLMRRFVHELGAGIEPNQKQEASRVLTLAATSPPYGELEVFGSQGALVRVDNRLLGVLPLSQPMLVPSGVHTVQLNLGPRHFAGPVEIRTGRTAQLRFDLQTGVAVVTLPPTILLIQDYGASPAALQDAWARAADQAIRAEQHAVLHPQAALVRAPELTPCIRMHRCQVQLMQRNEVDYTLVLSLLSPIAAAPKNSGANSAENSGGTAAPGGVVLRGELLDSSMGEDLADAVNQPIDPAKPEQAAALVGGLVTRLLKEGRARPRGTLEVQSTPPGSQVLLPRGFAGVTPYERPAWAGPYEVVVQKFGYKPARLTANVEADKKETLQVNLELLPAPPPRRPRWRTVTGAVAIGVGGTLILLSLPSLPSGDTDKLATDAALISLGAVLTVGGVLLLTLPLGKPKPPPTATAPVR